MNLEHLRYFETIARLEHYGRAAEVLHTTQPNLSHAVAQLEEELGVPLFEKSGRNVRLTRYGKSFLETVSYSLAHLDNSIRNLQEVSQGGGLIVLGAIRDLGTVLVPELMRGFLQTPEGRHVRFELHTGSSFSRDLLSYVEEGRYDMSFTSHPGEGAALESFAFAQSPFALAVPLGHPFAQRDSIDLAETLEEPYIFLSAQSGLRRAVDDLFHEIGQFPESSFETEEDSVAAGLAAAGFGIAVLPDHPFFQTLPLKMIPIIHPDARRNAWLSIRKRAWRSEAAQHFYDYCRAELVHGEGQQKRKCNL